MAPRQRRIRADVHVHLVGVRVGAALVGRDIVRRGCRERLAVVPRCVLGAGVDDLDGDFLLVSVVGDGVTPAAGGVRAARGYVAVVGQLVGGAVNAVGAGRTKRWLARDEGERSMARKGEKEALGAE